ncbi:MAG: hypothetical protein AAGC79_08150 [Pseudomonadota bacterium]
MDNIGSKQSYLDQMVDKLEAEYIQNNSKKYKDGKISDKQAQKIFVKLHDSGKTKNKGLKAQMNAKNDDLGYGIKLSHKKRRLGNTDGVTGAGTKLKNAFKHQLKDNHLSSQEVANDSSYKSLKNALVAKKSKAYITLAELRELKNNANKSVNSHKVKKSISEADNTIKGLKSNIQSLTQSDNKKVANHAKKVIEQIEAKFTDVKEGKWDYMTQRRHKNRDDIQNLSDLKGIVKFAKTQQTKLDSLVAKSFEQTQVNEQHQLVTQQNKLQMIKAAKQVLPLKQPAGFNNNDLTLKLNSHTNLAKSTQRTDDQSCALHAMNSFFQGHTVDDQSMHQSYKQVYNLKATNFQNEVKDWEDIGLINMKKPKPENVNSGFETDSVQWHLHNLGVETESIRVDTPISTKLDKPGSKGETQDQKNFMAKYGNHMVKSGRTKNEIQIAYANYLSMQAIGKAVEKLDESCADRVMVNSGTGNGTHWVSLHKSGDDWYLLDSLVKGQPKMDLQTFLEGRQEVFRKKGLVMNAQVLVPRETKQPELNESRDALNDKAKLIAWNLKSEGWQDGATVTVDQLKSSMKTITDTLAKKEFEIMQNLGAMRDAIQTVSDYIDNPGNFSILQESINDLNDLKAAAKVFFTAYS